MARPIGHTMGTNKWEARPMDGQVAGLGVEDNPAGPTCQYELGCILRPARRTRTIIIRCRFPLQRSALCVPMKRRPPAWQQGGIGPARLLPQPAAARARMCVCLCVCVRVRRQYTFSTVGGADHAREPLRRVHGWAPPR